jgi:hypothetical protein
MTKKEKEILSKTTFDFRQHSIEFTMWRKIAALAKCGMAIVKHGFPAFELVLFK